ncbi:unnamed protein product [Rotaria sp. Silwood1]|nr:unnamed protein product [Rotaria sp. Silwood1]CAF1346467.1 unnamed protein product [Rotaria sp. Silwood1]CAF4834523.1 unnamed protein product [Rotaria sp. Silwood1]CAF4847925.1 unnamed protein product [Rotaria sp. Silwood1]
MNTIWTLPNLIYCYFHEAFVYEWSYARFVVPTVISSSIKYLSIIGVDYGYQSVRIFEHTPNLKHLFVLALGKWWSFQFAIPILSITTLQFSGNSYSKPLDLVGWLPNLSKLKFALSNIQYYVSIGEEWEDIIHQHLKKLKIFQFKIEFDLNEDENNEKRIDRMLDTFRSRFWHDEHQWFIQYDWCLDEPKVCFYTLPYAFNEFHLDSFILSKSTCSPNKYQSSYDQVHHLICNVDFFKYSTLFNSQFCNIEKLSIRFPINEQLWFIIPTFDRLTSLDILSSRPDQNCKNQLQALLDRAPHLTTLNIHDYWFSWPSEMIIFNKNSASISQLNVLLSDVLYDNEQCIALCDVSLAAQCQVLSIRVTNRTCILDLINGMNNLRVLNVQCHDDQSIKNTMSDEDELSHWLSEHQPPSCAIFDIVRCGKTIHLWIR